MARVKDKAILAKVAETAVMKAERSKTLLAAVLLLRTWSLARKVNQLAVIAVIMEIQEEAVHANSW